MSILRQLMGGGGKKREKLSGPAHAISRKTIEMNRVKEVEPDFANLSPDLQKSLCFTPEEKARLYEVREMLNWLPSTGPSGGFLERVAKEVVAAEGLDCTRQYVHLVLYPENAAALFAARTPLHKLIWLTLERLANESVRSDHKNAGFVAIMRRLSRGDCVWVKNMRTCRLNVLKQKIRKSGMSVNVIIDRSKVPFDFLFVPNAEERAEGLHWRGAPGLMQSDLPSTKNIMEYVSGFSVLELIGMSRVVVDKLFPNANISRCGKEHYQVSLASTQPQTPIS